MLAAVCEWQPDRSEWFRCRKWIEAALVHAKGTHTIEDIEDGIEDGQFYFFSSPNSATVVEIIEYPRLKAINYFLAGGDLNELKTIIEPTVSQWAKNEMGCTRALEIGRKGLEKAFASSGYKHGWAVIYKEL